MFELWRGLGLCYRDHAHLFVYCDLFVCCDTTCVCVCVCVFVCIYSLRSVTLTLNPILALPINPTS